MPYLFWVLMTGKKLAKNTNTKALLVLILLWVTAIMVMPIYEKWTIFNTTWWFIVTIATIGYGDLYPATVAGKMCAIPIILLGLGTCALLVTNVASSLFTVFMNLRRNRMKGLSDYSKLKDHVIIMGWHDILTLEIINQLQAGSAMDKSEIVLCSESLEERPDSLPDKVRFVKGPIGSDDVLRRSGVMTAASIIITGRNDEETCLATLAVVTNDDQDKSHITVLIDNPDNAKHIHRLAKFHGDISIIKPITSSLITQEIEDKGIGEIISELLNNNSQASVHRIDLGKPRPWNDVKARGFIQDNVLPFACITEDNRRLINPVDNPRVTSIFVIAAKRPQLGDI